MTQLGKVTHWRIFSSVALLSVLALLSACEPSKSDGHTVPIGQCSPQNCVGGCCDSVGNCVMAPSDLNCGMGGAQCVQCLMGQRCDTFLGTCVQATPQGPCGPETCPGCCDTMTGQCMPGTDARSCGRGGTPCHSCEMQGLTCNFGTCGSGQCGPADCPNGCCMNGTCQQGTVPQACGRSGAPCAVCPPGQQCVNQQCQSSTCNPATCPGCCDAQGMCQMGTAESACGQGGAACVSCGPNQGCSQQRRCEDVSSLCGPGNCNGCCGMRGCEQGMNSQSCGMNGQMCQQCAPGQECVNGMCMCTPASCSSGCCDGPFCRTGNDWFACGRGGMMCQHCNGATCIGGRCDSSMGSGGQSCWGCWVGNQCVPGTQDSACGRFGEICRDCRPGTCDSWNQVCSGSGGPGGSVPGNAIWDVYVMYVEVAIPPPGYEWDKGIEALPPDGPMPEIFVEGIVGIYGRLQTEIAYSGYEAYFPMVISNRIGRNVSTQEVLQGIRYSVFDADRWTAHDRIAGECIAQVTDWDLSNGVMEVWGCPGQPWEVNLDRVVFSFHLVR